MRRLAIALVLCMLAARAISQSPAELSPKPLEKPVEALQIQIEHLLRDAAKPQQPAKSEPRATPGPASIVPSFHAESGNREGQPNAQESSEEGTEFWPPLYGFRLKITDTLVAGFTALLFFATVALWWATRRLVRGTDKTAERQIRAYVGIDKVYVEQFDTNSPVYINITMKNYGQTPAHDVQDNLRWGYCIPISSFDNIEQDPRPEAQKRVMWPADITVGRTKMIDSITEEQMANYALGATFWLVGRIKYKDIFGAVRRTDVSMQTQPLSRDFVFNADGNKIT